MSEQNKLYTDPVCGMKVKKPEEKDRILFSAPHKEKMYYFCSPFCTAAFLDDPERYIKSESNNGNDSQRHSV